MSALTACLLCDLGHTVLVGVEAAANVGVMASESSESGRSEAAAAGPSSVFHSVSTSW